MHTQKNAHCHRWLLFVLSSFIEHDIDIATQVIAHFAPNKIYIANDHASACILLLLLLCNDLACIYRTMCTRAHTIILVALHFAARERKRNDFMHIQPAMSMSDRRLQWKLTLKHAQLHFFFYYSHLTDILFDMMCV